MSNRDPLTRKQVNKLTVKHIHLMELRRWTYILETHGVADRSALAHSYGINLEGALQGKMLLSKILEDIEECLEHNKDAPEDKEDE